MLSEGSVTKFSVSNIGLPAFQHEPELRQLAVLGLHGVEVAPSRVWADTWKGLAPSDVAAYRKCVEQAGLVIVGLHSLFFDHPELGLFADAQSRAAALDFLVHLSGVCRDLGGHTLIYGGGRKRGPVPADDAREIALDFLGTYTCRTEAHGTCLCFEPLGPEDSDFINSAYDSLYLVRTLNHPAFRLQLDAKALVANNEVNETVFDDCAPDLVHFHANEPGLAVLGSSGTVDHSFMGEQLRRTGYDGFVSIEQRMLNDADPLSDIAQSADVLRSAYAPGDRDHDRSEMQK